MTCEVSFGVRSFRLVQSMKMIKLRFQVTLILGANLLTQFVEVIHGAGMRGILFM